jgi:hypothetical protein
MPGHQPAQDDRSDNKRRKIDAVAAAHLYPTASATCAQPHLNYSTLQRPVPSHTDGRHYVAWQPQPTHIATPCSDAPDMQHRQQQPAQWSQSCSSTPQGYVVNYHDPGSIQQTHNYGQTDPSAYISPWTPTQQDTQMGVHTPAMRATSQPHSMSYAQPLHSPVDSQYHSYDSGPSPSHPPSLQTFDVGNFETAHELQSQPNRQARKVSSDMHFEGASMHLKMRSLPILDSLVSGSRFVTPPLRLQPEKCSLCVFQL